MEKKYIERRALLIDNFSRVLFSLGIRRENFVFATWKLSHTLGFFSTSTTLKLKRKFLCSFLFDIHTNLETILIP